MIIKFIKIGGDVGGGGTDVSAHVGAVDPHGQYVLETAVGVPGGVRPNIAAVPTTKIRKFEMKEILPE